MAWRFALSGGELRLGDRALVMGVLNVTPDSFSDGGAHAGLDAAVRHGLSMVADGADILDIGGESTRPGAGEVPLADEIERVVPVVRELARRTDVPVSVDTRKAEVAHRAVEAGARIVNDVSGLGHDTEMAAVVARTGAGFVLTHMRGTPETMQDDPSYGDLFAEVTTYFRERLEVAAAAGVRPDQIVLDPGIGFGKTLRMNLELLARPDAFRSLGRPILLGPSRKSIYGKLLDRGVDERGPATLATVAIAAFLGAAILRVHDVAWAHDAVRVADAMRGARA